MNIDEIVITIRNSSTEVSEFIEDYKPFIATCASGVVKRFLSYGEDDELGIALSAFYEAIMVYDLKKGKFLTFARGVIQRRLIDFLRKQKKLKDRSVYIDEDEDQWQEYENYASIGRYETEREDENLKLEVESLEKELKQYGIEFTDLITNCPKHSKLISEIREAAAVFVSDEKLFIKFREMKRLPVKEIESITGLPQKKIDRFRKYIIAVSIILSGDYAYLKEYVKR
jgi:RNA polymerase sigma factor